MAHPGTPSAVARFAPPLALMAAIFALSAQPDLNSGLGTVDLVGRKLVHMTEYGVLWALWLRAFGWRRPWAAAAIAVAYAITDELHQTTVHGRHGSPVDVLIDTTGIAIAWLVWRWRGRKACGPIRPGRSPSSGSEVPSVVPVCDRRGHRRPWQGRRRSR